MKYSSEDMAKVFLLSAGECEKMSTHFNSQMHTKPKGSVHAEKLRVLSEDYREAVDRFKEASTILNGELVGLDTKDLVFSATEKCQCGEGLAYPRRVGLYGSWYCYTLLTGEAQEGSIHTKESFAFSLTEEETSDISTRPQVGSGAAVEPS